MKFHQIPSKCSKVIKQKLKCDTLEKAELNIDFNQNYNRAKH